MSSHQKLKEQIIQKISERRYGSVLVKGAIRKQQGIWKNVVIKILPMYLSDTYTVKEKLDYGNFAMVEDVITLKDLVEPNHYSVLCWYWFSIIFAMCWRWIGDFEIGEKAIEVSTEVRKEGIGCVERLDAGTLLLEANMPTQPAKSPTKLKNVLNAAK